MIVYLMRHGQSEGNAQRRHQFPTSPLSALGETQAAKLAERLKSIKLDELWSSPLRRARQTADIINEYQQVPITEIAEFREIKRASVVEGRSYDDPEVKKMQRISPNHGDVGSDDPYFKFQDGESFAEFVVRVTKAVTLLKKKAAQENDDYVLGITSHGFVVNVLFLLLTLGKYATPEALHYAMSTLKHENTGITTIRLPRSGEPRLLTFGDFSHL